MTHETAVGMIKGYGGFICQSLHGWWCGELNKRIFTWDRGPEGYVRKAEWYPQAHMAVVRSRRQLWGNKAALRGFIEDALCEVYAAAPYAVVVGPDAGRELELNARVYDLTDHCFVMKFTDGEILQICEDVKSGLPKSVIFDWLRDKGVIN